MNDRAPWWRRLTDMSLRDRLVAVVGVVAVLVPLWYLGGAYLTWRSLDRIESDPDDAVATLNSLTAGRSGDPDTDGPAPVNTRPDAIEGETTFLLIGTDDRSGLDDLSDFGAFEGRRADVIVLATVRPVEQRVRLVSLPRDLAAPDLCEGSGVTRLGDNLEGCGPIDGETMLQIVVEQVTGIGVDHVASIGLEGFQEVVDELGGYEICVDHAVRDSRSGLSLDAGCTVADGRQTLAWIRSRRTQELRNGRWTSVSNANDLLRNQRERMFLVDMLDRVIDATNISQIQGLAATIAPHVSVDGALDLPGLVQTAWNMRLLDRSGIETVSIPVADVVVAGQALLEPTVDIPEYLLG